MSSIPLPTRPARGRHQSTRPQHRGGYRTAIDAAEKRGREQTGSAWMKLAGDLIKTGQRKYWQGYAQGLTDFARNTDDAPAAEVATEYAQNLAGQYAAEGFDTRDWTLPASAVVPGTEVPDVEHLPCPVWCVDCWRSEPGSPDHTRFHHGDEASVTGRGEQVEREYAAHVTVERLDDGERIAQPTDIYLVLTGPNGVNLTAAAARQLAAHLLNAADTVDAEVGAA
jgi:hypothetical protein